MPTEPSWLIIARSYLGVAEIPGPSSDPVIMRWAKNAGGWVKSFFVNDDIPWCALFVNNVLLEDGLKGTGTLAALDFKKWGVELKEPALGAIVVFQRPGGGHVGFYLGQRADGAVRVLGGNQSNAVTDNAWLAGNRLVSVRWPPDRPLPTSGPIRLAANGATLSTNEA